MKEVPRKLFLSEQASAGREKLTAAVYAVLGPRGLCRRRLLHLPLSAVGNACSGITVLHAKCTHV